MPAYSAPPEPAQTTPEPVMRVTIYDRVSSFMMALVAALILGVLSVVAVWFANRPPPPLDLVPLEMLAISGGFEDGSPDESWDLQSPDPEDPNASLTEEPTEDLQIEEVLDNVVEMSDQATEQFERVNADASANFGNPGSATGTGGRPLGMGPGTGGVPAEQRWFIRFMDDRSIDEYAKQLDYFGIELGVITPDGKLTYVSQLSQGRPQTRVVDSGADEKRLYMTWQSGERKTVDANLLKKAGITVDRRTAVFHFYPPKTEQMLGTLEVKYRSIPAQKIKRTYFLVKKQGNGYEFEVTRQSYL